MHHRKGFRYLLRGLLIVLALSIAVVFSVVSSAIPAHAAVHGPSHTYSWPLVGPGSTGEDVYSVQLMLQGYGYALSANGTDDTRTTSAVTSFQAAHGLRADGVVGPEIWPVLIITTKQGSTGSAVVALQRHLNAHGAALRMDGKFGSGTTSAVQRFQSSHGLGVDGIADPQTWNALVSVNGAQAYSWPIVGRGAAGENVYSIQLMLQGHGYAISIDGSYGPQTTSTVASFQSAHGLGADGVVGPQTWPVLIIATAQGSSGSAVVALQRQLNVHGAGLSVDGAFGPATTAAVRNFQSSHGLGVDGIAGQQTWSALVNQAGPPPPPPPPPPPGSILWGVDTVSVISPSFLGQIDYNLGAPQFIGRYLDGLYTPLNGSEAGYIHSQGIHILPILPDFAGDTGYNRGVGRANDAVSKARALGIPARTIIVADIENNSTIDAGYIQGWYNTIAGAGYTTGYYENPYPGSSGFDGAFCAAVGGDAGVASSILYSAEPDIGETPRSSAPRFGPSGLLCNGQDRGGHSQVWQYGIQGNSSINVDTNESQSSVPLW